jgi:methylmalonyl-CoA mutase
MADHPSSETFSGPFSLGPDFPNPSLESWRAKAVSGLKGRPVETLTKPVDDGIEVKVLYSSEDHPDDSGIPGVFPFTRGGPLPGPARQSPEVCALITHPDVDVAAQQISDEIHRGAHSIWLRLSGGVRRGIDLNSPEATQSNSDGIIVQDVHDFEELVGDIDLTAFGVHLEAGGSGVAAAATYIAAIRRRGLSPDGLKGSFSLDPLGSLVSDGFLISGIDRSFDLISDLARWCLGNAPGIRALSVSTLPHHSAGATPVQELAFALATGVEYLRTLETGGIHPEDACRQLRFVFATGRDLFAEVAKIRAFRQIWAQAARSSGVNGPEAAAVIHSVSSRRNLTIRDPWTNLLRVTVGAFAATVAGSDLVTTVPFDSLIGPSETLARRLALNTQTILNEECHVNRVIDPGGGSWFIEKLTDDMAHAAWSAFQEIEKRGGMRRLVIEKQLTGMLAPPAETARHNVARRKTPITGVSTWPLLEEKGVTRDAPDVAAILDRLISRLGSDTGDADVQKALASLGDKTQRRDSVIETALETAERGATLAQISTALRGDGSPSRTIPLPVIREATPFEDLRSLSDTVLTRTGARPSIFLANLGPIPEHTARATFAKNFFEAGGIQTLNDGGFDTIESMRQHFTASGAAIACICGSDDRYGGDAGPTARALKQAGAATVCLAGRPGDNEGPWREAGIDHFIFVGCDVLETLQSLMTGLEVSS